jgi:ribosome production factor 1
LLHSPIKLFIEQISTLSSYIFETKESKSDKGKEETIKPRLQECGPRFTLKLVTLQHGTFDTKGGEFEWVHKPEMDTSRRRFFL